MSTAIEIRDSRFEIGSEKTDFVALDSSKRFVDRQKVSFFDQTNLESRIPNLELHTVRGAQ